MTVEVINVAGVALAFFNAENLVLNLQCHKFTPKIQLEALERAKADFAFSAEEDEYLSRQIAGLKDFIKEDSNELA